MPLSHNWQCSRLITGELQVRPLQAAPHRQHVRQINLIAKHGSPSKGGKDYHMALKRADIRTILENPETSNDDKAKAILDALHKETDELKDQLDAEKEARTQAEKDRDAANGGKEAAEKALTDYKAQQTQKDTRAAKAAAYKQLLKDNGVYEKYFDRVVKMTGADIDALELDENGKAKNAKKFMDNLKDEVWGNFVFNTKTEGAKVDTPPTNTGSKMTKDQIFAIKDAGERQAAIAANADLFTGGGKD